MTREPRQLTFTFHPDNHSSFLRGLIGTPEMPGVLSQGSTEGESICSRYIKTWRHTSDYQLTDWTKELLEQLLDEDRIPEATNLVLGFGFSFHEDEVDVAEMEVLEFARQSQVVDLREAALTVFEFWLHAGSNTDVLKNIIERHLPTETDSALQEHCQELLLEIIQDEADEESDYDEYEEEDEDEDDEDAYDPPELDIFHELEILLPNNITAELNNTSLIGLVESLSLHLDRRFILALMESVRVGNLVAEDNRFNLLLTHYEDSWQVYAWRVDRTMILSLSNNGEDSDWLFTLGFSNDYVHPRY